ncbi:MAG: RecQ family zinc-binding domain-containing protein, partial [Alistipes sp.]|nr:RecQ family zinc-binding domain-containing protein [Alistipes sp.]
IPAARTAMIYFNSERLPQKDVYIAPETYRYRYDRAVERFNSMLRYTTTTDECRSKIIEEYFGEPNARDCRICDICISKRKKTALSYVPENIDTHILSMLADGEVSIKDIVAAIGGRSELIAERIDYLLNEKKISVSISGKVKINK